MNGRAFVKELGKKARRKFAICPADSTLSSSKKNVDQPGDLGKSFCVFCVDEGKRVPDSPFGGNASVNRKVVLALQSGASCSLPFN
jgi:hypothetical protein